MYLFIFKSYIIVRYFDGRSRDTRWYTAAVRRGTGDLAAEWSQDMSICTNKELALKVDSITGV